MFKFEISLTEQDYLQFNQYHVINSLAGKKAMKSIKFLYIFLSLVMILVFYITTDDFNVFVFKACAMAVVAVVGIFTTKKLTLSSVKRQIKSLSKSGRLPYSTNSIVTFNDDNIQEITQSSEAKTAYNLVEKIVLANNAFYIYFSSVQAYIIPYRCFKTQEEKQGLIDFLKSKTNADVQQIQ